MPAPQTFSFAFHATADQEEAFFVLQNRSAPGDKKAFGIQALRIWPGSLYNVNLAQSFWVHPYTVTRISSLTDGEDLTLVPLVEGNTFPDGIVVQRFANGTPDPQNLRSIVPVMADVFTGIATGGLVTRPLGSITQQGTSGSAIWRCGEGSQACRPITLRPADEGIAVALADLYALHPPLSFYVSVMVKIVETGACFVSSQYLAPTLRRPIQWGIFNPTGSGYTIEIMDMRIHECGRTGLGVWGARDNTELPSFRFLRLDGFVGGKDASGWISTYNADSVWPSEFVFQRNTFQNALTPILPGNIFVMADWSLPYIQTLPLAVWGLRLTGLIRRFPLSGVATTLGASVGLHPSLELKSGSGWQWDCGRAGLQPLMVMAGQTVGMVASNPSAANCLYIECQLIYDPPDFDLLPDAGHVQSGVEYGWEDDKQTGTLVGGGGGGGGGSYFRRRRRR